MKVVLRIGSEPSREVLGEPGSTQLVAPPVGHGSTLDSVTQLGSHIPLVMPGPRDGVRQQVLATAKRLAIGLDVILDVSSVSMMKNMVARGDATAVMSYGNVFDEIASGRIVGRRIANPPLKRTLYLIRAMRRAPFAQESGILRLLAQVSRQYVNVLGPLATPLPALQDPARLASLAATQ